MSKIHWGKHSYGNPILRGDISNIYIGNYTSIAQDVVMDCGFHHNTDFVSTFPFNAVLNRPEITSHPKTKGDIHIGNDVWVGEGALIMGGVKIHDGAVVGSRAVVTKDVDAYSVVVGVPARFSRFRVSYKQKFDLLNMKWWNWPDEKVKEFILLLMSSDIQKFIDEANKIK